MKTVLVNKERFNFTENNLPVLIHGEEGSGASFYTIVLIANLFSQGFKILTLCGYHMAEDEFKKQVGDLGDKAVFYTKEKEFEFLLSNLEDEDKRIILIKNVELFEDNVISTILKNKNVIISGDLNKCAFKKKILEKSFPIKIFFSKLTEIETPITNKYEGFFISDKLQGVTKV